MRKSIALLTAFALTGAMSAYAADLAVPTTENAPAPKPAAVEATEPMNEMSVVEIAQAKADLSTFVQTVEAAGLTETFSASGPFTVFAPSNAAFAALPAGTLEAWTAPGNKKALADTLSYHVVAGKILASDIPEGETDVPTLNGGTIKLKKTGSDVWVNGAKVAEADLAGQNGIVHVIDTVLTPSAATN